MCLYAMALVGLMLNVSAEASSREQVLGQVRLDGGLPVAGAQVLLFDLADLRRGAVAQATTDADGQFALAVGTGLPTGFALGQNYPNPFNPGTVIPYELAADGYVRLEVLNLLGQRVAVLVDGERAVGVYTATWTAIDGSGQAVSAGVYLYRLTVDGASQTGRMVLVDGQAGFSPLARSEASTLSSAETLVEARSMEAAGSSYGLVVLGAGLVAYVDADFRVGAGSVAIEMTAVDQGRGKVVQRVIRRLGDVDGNGQITFSDALLVMAYSLNRSVSLPDGGDISLGDVDEDGQVTLTDAWLIATYVVNSSDPVLPAGIGLPTGEPGSHGGELVVSLPGGAEMEFVWIGPGTFQMGSPNSESGRDNDEKAHEVEISQGFYLGKYEITQGQWESVMGETPWSGESYVQSNSSHPAVYISWEDVRRFAAKLNSEAGEAVYRLPTEAEWEYACRAGTQTRWSFGDDEFALGSYAWYADNAWNAGEQYAHAVGTKLPNPWGLYDMHGNVWEWVNDWYGESYYNSSPRVDPPGPTSGSYRVFRGGHFGNDAQAFAVGGSRWVFAGRSQRRHWCAPSQDSLTL